MMVNQDVNLSRVVPSEFFSGFQKAEWALLYVFPVEWAVTGCRITRPISDRRYTWKSTASMRYAQTEVWKF